MEEKRILTYCELCGSEFMSPVGTFVGMETAAEAFCPWCDPDGKKSARSNELSQAFEEGKLVFDTVEPPEHGVVARFHIRGEKSSE